MWNPPEMALSREHEAVLEQHDVTTIRQRLMYAGPGPGAAVPGLGDGMMTRADVERYTAERYTAEREKREARRAVRRPWIIAAITIAAGALIAAGSAFVWYHLRSTIPVTSTQEKRLVLPYKK